MKTLCVVFLLIASGAAAIRGEDEERSLLRTRATGTTRDAEEREAKRRAGSFSRTNFLSFNAARAAQSPSEEEEDNSEEDITAGSAAEETTPPPPPQVDNIFNRLNKIAFSNFNSFNGRTPLTNEGNTIGPVPTPGPTPAPSPSESLRLNLQSSLDLLLKYQQLDR